MTIDQFSRTRLVYGPDGVDRLAHAHVAVFGIGGVGGHATESLVRSGLGTITLVDSDEVSLTNLNRQIIATHRTIGMPKVDAMEERLHAINPTCRAIKRRCFFLPENADEFDFAAYDFVIDAVDTVTAKIALIEHAKAAGTPVVSAMGAGNKTDPTALRIADVSETSVCPLARIMRKELKKRGIRNVPVAYSLEPPTPPHDLGSDVEAPAEGRRAVPGSNAFVPSAMGLAIGAYVARKIMAG